MKPIGKLLAFGMGGLGLCVAMAQLFKRKVSSQIKGSEFYEEAMELLKKHSGARYLLGEPIIESLAKFNSLGEAFGQATEVKVYVAGPKSNGILFFTLTGDNEDKRKVNTVQLQIGRDDSKRLVIRNPPKEESGGSQ